MTEQSVNFTRRDWLTMGLIVAGVAILATVIVSSQRAPDIILRPDDGGIGLRLDLERNAFLADLPRHQRDDWANQFAAMEQRAAYPIALRIEAIDLETDILGVGLDSNGLIVAPPRSAGHFMLSARPNEANNIVIVGHSGTGLIFQNLADVSEGDSIILTSDDNRQHRYRVEDKITLDLRRADADDLQQNLDFIMPTEHETLTIITCYPRDDYSQRLIIRAVPQD